MVRTSHRLPEHVHGLRSFDKNRTFDRFSRRPDQGGRDSGKPESMCVSSYSKLLPYCRSASGWSFAVPARIAAGLEKRELANILPVFLRRTRKVLISTQTVHLHCEPRS